MEKSRYKWEDNIKTDLQEIGWEGKSWFHQAHDSHKRQGIS
jgi:hypothetical protein